VVSQVNQYQGKGDVMAEYILTFRDGTAWFMPWSGDREGLRRAMDRFVPCYGPVATIKEWVPPMRQLALWDLREKAKE
jgi:hypothetical protein